jgi:Uma2 family endonuclease
LSDAERWLHAQGAGSYPPLDQIDNVVTVLTGWGGLERFLEAKGEKKNPRITYLRGVLELRSPSVDHEAVSTKIGVLLHFWAVATGTRLNGYGSWTLKDRKGDVALEPDECFVLGGRKPRRRPDLAVEVNWSRSGLDKLSVYHPLGVPEVWMWEKGQLQVWVRRPKGYVRAARSHLLPALDLKLISRLSLYTDTNRASKALLKSLGLKLSR